MSAEDLKRQALALNPLERAGLIEALLASFDADARIAVDEAWAREAEDRIDAFDAGAVKAITLEDAKARFKRSEAPNT